MDMNILKYTSAGQNRLKCKRKKHAAKAPRILSILAVLSAILLSGVPAFASENREPGGWEGSYPYDAHGYLSVSGSSLMDNSGNTFLLQGVYIDNFTEYPEYLDRELLLSIRDNWNINVIRLCLDEDDRDAFLSHDTDPSQNPGENLAEILRYAAKTTNELGLYLIISWYTPEYDFFVDQEKGSAKSFFSEITSEIGFYGNILYEIGGSGASSWEETKNYASEVIDVIRANSPQNIVIVDVPGDLDKGDFSPNGLVDRSNLLYAISVDSIMEMNSFEKLEDIAGCGMPLVVDQFDIAEDDGSVDAWQADMWKDLMDRNQIGYLIGPLCSQKGGRSLLTMSISDTGRDFELSTSALWFVDRIGPPARSQEEFFPSEAAVNTINQALANGCTAQISQTAGTYGTTQSCEYDITIFNFNEYDVNGWFLRLTWTGDVEAHDYWNCDIGGSGSSRLLAAKDFNKVIPAGSSVSFGIIISGETCTQLTGVWLE